MNYICDHCSKYPCTDDETKIMLSCPAFSPKPEPMTHFDEIKAMSVEELAACMATIEKKCYARCGFKSNFKRFINQWLDWLKSPADKEGEV